MSLGGNDRLGTAGKAHSNQSDDEASNTAKIIPLRPWFDASPAQDKDSSVLSADEKGSPSKAKIAEPPSVEPSLRDEAKTPTPGSTVVIEQAVPAPPLQRGGDRDGGGSSGGGGGGGGGGAPPMHKRFSDHEFRDVLGKGLANARRNLVTVGIFSVVVNLLVLAIPIYLFNMSDRVLTSRSTDTLVMLTIIVVIAIAAHVLMDMMRRIILMRVAVPRRTSG